MVKKRKVSNLIHKNREEIRDFCSKSSKVYIYGAGLTAGFIAKYLKEEEIRIEAYIISDIVGDKKEINGIPIRAVSEIRFGENDGIIIGLGKKLQPIVYESLIKQGIHERKIYCQDIYLPTDTPYIMYPSLISGKLKDEVSKNGYFADQSELDCLGRKYGTDKSSDFHNYLNKYEFFLSKFKNEKINVLELGVQNGKSLMMWGDYFSQAIIYGVDIDEGCKKYEGGNRKVIVQDLSDEDGLDKLADLKCSIVIDDASHMWSHQIKSMSHIIPQMPSGGVFIMEDLETSFPSYRNWIVGDAVISAYEFCEALVYVVCSREHIREETAKVGIWKLKEEIESIGMQLEMAAMIHGSCIMVKR